MRWEFWHFTTASAIFKSWIRRQPLQKVKDIVDEAIAHAERGGLKKAFSIITSRRYDDDDYVILHEKDFGF